MNKSIFHKIQSLLLITALAFGQVGAGFLHNKHDAHETVLDLDHTVLVPHGEHCKVCSIDWVHQFLAVENVFITTSVQPQSFEQFNLISSSSFSHSRSSDRAPPVMC